MIFANMSSVSPLPGDCVTLLKRLGEDLAQPDFYLGVYQDLEDNYGKVRELLAKILRADPARFALCTSTSEGVSKSILCLDWKPGDLLLYPEAGFDSIRPAALAVERFGSAAKGAGDALGCLTPEMLETEEPKPKAIVVEWVNYRSGYKNSISALSAYCRSRGIILIVDGVQGLGSCPMEFSLDDVDFLVSGGHKWLQAPEGTGLIYCSRPGLIRFPPLPGFRTTSPGEVSALETGTLSSLAFMGFRQVLQTLGCPKGYANRVQSLAEIALEAREVLAGSGRIRLVLSDHPSALSPVISFSVDGLHPEEVLGSLILHQVMGKVRKGLVRLSFGPDTCIHSMRDSLRNFIQSLNQTKANP